MQFKYIGLIQGNKKGSRSILIRLNGEEKMVELGDKLEDFVIRSATEDTLCLSKGKELKYYKRE